MRTILPVFSTGKIKAKGLFDLEKISIPYTDLTEANPVGAMLKQSFSAKKKKMIISTRLDLFFFCSHLHY